MKRFFLTSLLSFGILLSFVVVPHVVFAAPTLAGAVQCGHTGDKECGFSDLIVLIQQVINFTIFNIIIPIMTIMILWTGVKLLLPGEKQVAELSMLKTRIAKMLIGIFFMFAAWLIVDLIVKTLNVNVSEDPETGVYNFLER